MTNPPSLKCNPKGDELFLYAPNPIEDLGLLVQAISNMHISYVVFDCDFWLNSPEVAKALAKSLYSKKIPNALHTLIHPGDAPNCTKENVTKMYEVMKSTGIYDDGAGTPHRSDAELNAKLYPEIKEVLDALPWAPTYFATANGAQTKEGITSVGFRDWYAPWGEPPNYSQNPAEQILGGAKMALEAANEAQGAHCMMGWVRSNNQAGRVWNNSAEEWMYIAATIQAADTYKIGISWQFAVEVVLALNQESKDTLSKRARTR